MTALYVCLLIALFYVFGLPFVRLISARDELQKWVIAPVLGLSAGILVTNLLAWAGLTGRTIAATTLIFFGILAIRETAFHRRDRRRGMIKPAMKPRWHAIVPFVLAAMACGIVASPLLIKGVGNYWGFANPDQPFYMSIFDRLYQRPYGLPGAAEVGGVYPKQLPSSSVILGLSYYPSILSLLTGLLPSDCFDILCAAVFFLIPLSIFYLTVYGLALDFRLGIATTAAAVTSSLAVNTFYLSSLGALTVGVYVSIALALVLQYGEEATPRLGVLIAGVLAAAYFCYYPGFAVTGIAAGSALMVSLLRGKLPIPKLVWLSLATLGIVALTFGPQALTIIRALVHESLSHRLAADANNETLMFFALSLTEEIVPFLWGFQLPGSSVVTASLANQSFYILFTAGLFLTAVLLWGMRRRISGLRLEFSVATFALLSVLCAYLFTRNGYGVFKLVAYIHPILLVAFCASCFGLWASAAGRRRTIRRWAPLLALGAYILFNAWQSALLIAAASQPSWIVRFPIGAELIAGYHNAAQLRYSEFRDLRAVDLRLSGLTLNVAAPDPVIQRWMAPFVGKSDIRFLPFVNLDVENSDSPVRPRELVEINSPLVGCLYAGFG